ncbi:MAG: MoxR family ATPase [Deltaproteobacteria bacterium]|nr:MoxR family ATPase [Deltaproteobacteria bacterium]
MEGLDEVRGRTVAVRRAFEELRDELGRVVVGHEELIEQVFVALVCGGHCLLEGVPGLGKTLMVRSLAEVLNLTFSRIQFTPDLMPADITGTNVLTDDAAGKKVFDFQPGPVFAHIVLADEINRATPKTQSALLEAMQEQSVTVGLLLQYPSREELSRIADLTTAPPPPPLRKVLDAEAVLKIRDWVREVPIAEPVKDYAVRLVMATHPHKDGRVSLADRYVLYGSSPRGLQSLILAAKARSLLTGRPNVSFQDIRSVMLPGLRHRIILNLEADAEGITAEKVLEAAAEGVAEIL